MIDDKAPPPPLLSNDNIRALGTGTCQMNPKDLSDDALDYDSTNDSVE